MKFSNYSLTSNISGSRLETKESVTPTSTHNPPFLFYALFFGNRCRQGCHISKTTPLISGICWDTALRESFRR